MTSERQVDILVAILSALVTFVGCVLYFGVPIEIASMISAGVFLAGFFLGRTIWEVVSSIF